MSKPKTLALSLSAITHSHAAAEADAPQPGHLSIHGVDYYYEVQGRGEPLLLLHGGLGSIDMFRPVLATFVNSRKLIAVDLHGHGRTPLGERAFSLEAMGDDMAQLVKRLGHDQVDVLGYSLGGGVALRMAIQQPHSVRRLVLVSTPCSSDAFHPDIRAQQRQIGAAAMPMMKETPMYKSYVSVAPKPEEFPRLLDTLGQFMRANYDWSSDIPKLAMPVMLVFGDGDMFTLQSEIAFYQLLGGGLRDAGWARETLSKNRLAILPDVTHYEIFASPRLAPTVLPFLNGQSDAMSWAEQQSGK
ncbi:MAG TPA: alpha/beta fold hydrolase [Polyangiales bacterium]|jgi:pimeloyl-ACP methyl ester carboxylesterase